MNQRIRIGAGSRVEGSHGPLITNPNASIKQRIRSKAIGTVVRAAGPHKWEVIFDYDAKVKTVSSRSLSIVAADAGIPLDEEGAVGTVLDAVSILCVRCLLLIAHSHIIVFPIEYNSAGIDRDGQFYDHHIDCGIKYRRRCIKFRCN